MKILGKYLENGTYHALETQRVSVGFSSPKDEPNNVVRVYTNHDVYEIRHNDGTCLTKESANQLVKQIAITNELIDLDMFQVGFYSHKEIGIPVTNIFDDSEGEAIPLIVTNEEE